MSKEESYMYGVPIKLTPPTELWQLEEFKKSSVNHPKHYNHNWAQIECIDALEASGTPVEHLGYCKQNGFKYLWRYANKGKAEEDLDKGLWYMHRLTVKFKEYADKGLIIITENGLNNVS